MPRDTGIPRAAKTALTDGERAKPPGERVFAPPATDNQYVHLSSPGYNIINA